MLLLDRDPDDPDGEMGRRRVLAHVKSNDGPEMPSLLYEIEPIVLPATAEEPESDTSRLALLGESPHSGRALLASAAASEEERFAKDEAEEFLRAELEDGARHPAGDMIKAAKQIGISEPTLSRARRKLGVETEKKGFGGSGAWEWWLPKKSRETSKPAFLHEGVSPREVTPLLESPSTGQVQGLLSDAEITTLGTASLDEISRRLEQGEL